MQKIIITLVICTTLVQASDSPSPMTTAAIIASLPLIHDMNSPRDCRHLLPSDEFLKSYIDNLSPENIALLYKQNPDTTAPAIKKIFQIAVKIGHFDFMRRFLPTIQKETKYVLQHLEDDAKKAKYDPEMLKILEPYFPQLISEIKYMVSLENEKAWMFAFNAF